MSALRCADWWAATGPFCTRIAAGLGVVLRSPAYCLLRIAERTRASASFATSLPPHSTTSCSTSGIARGSTCPMWAELHEAELVLHAHLATCCFSLLFIAFRPPSGLSHWVRWQVTTSYAQLSHRQQRALGLGVLKPRLSVHNCTSSDPAIGSLSPHGEAADATVACIVCSYPHRARVAGEWK
jgi:hypothetical protein